MRIDELIKNQYRNLSETEKEIFKFMLTKANNLNTIGIKEVAKATYCHPNTIVRMAKKMGFGGYTELKHTLLYSLAQKGDEKKFTSNQLHKDIVQTQTLLSINHLEEIAKLIMKKQKISIFGLGPSRFCADIFASRIAFLGIASSTFIDQHAMFFHATNVSKDDICLFISYSGEQKAIITPALLAKGKEATTISLTGISDNELSRIVDYQLYFKSTIVEVGGADMTSRIPADMVLNILFEKLLEQIQANV